MMFVTWLFEDVCYLSAAMFLRNFLCMLIWDLLKTSRLFLEYL